MTPSDSSAVALIGSVVTGQSVRVTATSLEMHDPEDGRVHQIPLERITAVRRGGTDVVLLRRDADPISLTFRRLAVAQALEHDLATRLGLRTRSMTIDARRAPW